MSADILALRSRPSTASQPDLAALLERRRSTGAMRLSEPGPTPHELHRMLTIAARVPDHGSLSPWRFVLVEGEARRALADRLGEACMAATGQTDEAARRIVQKLGMLFGHPPLVVLVVSRPDPTATIPVWEQTLSAGAACMNLITAATALGFGANWLTGWAASNPAARPVLGLADGETLAGIVPIGTSSEPVPDRPRPELSRIVTAWAG